VKTHTLQFLNQEKAHLENVLTDWQKRLEYSKESHLRSIDPEPRWIDRQKFTDDVSQTEIDTFLEQGWSYDPDDSTILWKRELEKPETVQRRIAANVNWCSNYDKKLERAIRIISGRLNRLVKCIEFVSSTND
jgi:hypothetical protein